MRGCLSYATVVALMLIASAEIATADWLWGQVDKNGNINLYDRKGNWSWGKVDKDGSIYVYDQDGNWSEGKMDSSGKIDLHDQKGNRSWGQVDKSGNIDLYDPKSHRSDDNGNASKNNRHAKKSSKSKLFIAAGGSISITMDAKPMKKVYLVDPKIADIRVLTPYNLEVTGKSKGVTSLKIWDTAGNKVVYTVIVLKESFQRTP